MGNVTQFTDTLAKTWCSFIHKEHMDMAKLMTTLDVSQPEGKWLEDEAHETQRTIPEIVKALIRAEMDRRAGDVRLDPQRLGVAGD